MQELRMYLIGLVKKDDLPSVQKEDNSRYNEYKDDDDGYNDASKGSSWYAATGSVAATRLCPRLPQGLVHHRRTRRFDNCRLHTCSRDGIYIIWLCNENCIDYI